MGTVIEQALNTVSSTQQGALGSVLQHADGREWRYGSAGATALSAGMVTQAPAGVAAHQACAVAVAASVGDTQVQVTLGATAATENQYKEGYLVLYDASGVALQISGNPAIDASGTGVFNLAQPLPVALTTSSKVSLVVNPQSSLVISAHGATTALVGGVPGLAVAASSFAWFQTKGVASVLTNGTPAVGSGVIISATTDGAVDVEAATTVTERIGTVYAVAGVTTKYNVVNLSI